MRKCFLHVGPPKSGTSAIQAALKDNLHMLSQHGIFVPESGQRRSGSHYHLAHALADEPMPMHKGGDILLEFERELDKTSDAPVLISSEYFWLFLSKPSTGERIVERLKRLGLDVTVLFYARNQAQRLNSAYVQSVKSVRLDKSFEAFLNSALKRDSTSGYGRWLDIAGNLGVGLVARPFTASALKDGLVRDFLATVGGRPAASEEPDLVRNRSIGPFWVDVARRATRHAGGADLGREAHLEGRRMLRRQLLKISIVEPPFCGLTTESARRIEAHFRDDNDRFANAIWGQRWEDLFASDVGREFECNDYDVTGVPDEVAATHSQVLARITQELDALTLKESARLRIARSRPEGGKRRGLVRPPIAKVRAAGASSTPLAQGKGQKRFWRALEGFAAIARSDEPKSAHSTTQPLESRRIPLHGKDFPLVLMFCQKAGCTTLTKWFLYHTGRLDEALAYGRWIHRYRTEVLTRQPGYKAEAARLARSGERPFVKLVRNPYDRAVSSFLHTLKQLNRVSKGGWEIELLTAARRHAGKSRGHRPALSFLDFMRHVEATGTSLDQINGHVAKQFMPLEREVSPRIIQLEHFQEEIRKIEDEFGLPRAPIESISSSKHHRRKDEPGAVEPGAAAALEFTREDVTTTSMLPYTAFYNEETRMLVRRAFSDDFEAYGYPA